MRYGRNEVLAMSDDAVIRAFSYRSSFGCWEWLRAVNACGYGWISRRGRIWLAHRLSWVAFNGNIPSGRGVLHKCDNRACVNPDHLWLGSQRDNMRDASAKGRLFEQPGYSKFKLGRSDHPVPSRPRLRPKLNPAQVEELRALVESGMSCADAAVRFAVGTSTIYRIIGRQMDYTHVV